MVFAIFIICLFGVVVAELIYRVMQMILVIFGSIFGGRHFQPQELSRKPIYAQTFLWVTVITGVIYLVSKVLAR